jgi:hypothetical protein
VIAKLIGLGVLAAAALFVVREPPSLRRYLKIERM